MMFDPTKEVPSLELCKELKELGFPQDIGGWYWCKIKELPPSPIRRWKLVYANSITQLDKKLRRRFDKVYEIIKAPTLREVLEWLPIEIEYKGETLYLEFDRPDETQFLVSYCYAYERICPIAIGDDEIINAPTKMLIYLTYKGYVSF